MGEVIEATVIGEEEVISEDQIERAEEVGSNLQQIADEATDIEVKDDESYEKAIERKRNLEALYNLVESIIEPMRSSAYEHYKDILGYKKTLLTSGEQAIEYLKSEAEEYASEKKRVKAESSQSDGEDESEDVPDVEGTHYRENWSGNVTDIKKLCEAVANGEVPEDVVMPNSPRINKLARQFKENLDKIPGLEFEVTHTLVDRG